MFETIYYLNVLPERKTEFDPLTLDLVPKDAIIYRYEIIENLGKGAFGKVFKVFDHKDQKHCALKILFNKDNLKE